MDASASINWFPGHIAKAIRKIYDDIKFVDVVLEVLDARIPKSSRNRDVWKEISRPFLLVLNKSDLADPVETKRWLEYYKSKGIHAVSMECKCGKNINLLKKEIQHIMEEKRKKWQLKGMENKKARVMIVGQPNTGKSSLINRFAKGYKVKSENRPGVTKANQWISIDKNIELLDTPGVLPPKIQDKLSQYSLAFTGAIKDEVLDRELIALELTSFLSGKYPNLLKERYKLQDSEVNSISGYELLSFIGKKHQCLASGGEIDILRTSDKILSDFRSGKIGRITLELPPSAEIKQN